MVLPSNVVDYLQVKESVTVPLITATGIITEDINMFNGDTSNSSTIVAGITNGLKIGTNPVQKIGFYGTTPVAQLTGVAVSAAGIHAALVSLGLIAA